MKKVLFLLLVLVLNQSCMKRIDAGHTGIKFNRYGITDERGVSDKEIVSGTTWYNPFVRSVYEYPHYWQDVEYREISFNSSEGEPILADLKVVYRLRKDKIGETFDEYRLAAAELSRNIIQSLVLETLSAEAGKMSAVDIMGVSREELLRETTNALNESYSTNFEFQLVTFTSKLKPSENVKTAIQGVIQAQEDAKKAQAKTVEIQEAALQRVINARADSSSRVIEAAGKAREIELVQRQLLQSPQYIEYLKAQKWNGELPKVTGGVMPFMNVDKQ